MSSSPTLISEHACYGGVQRFYRHESRETRGPMKFAAYLPPQAKAGTVPVLYFLSGLTCTEETFCIKSHAQKSAAELGLMLISPDTSPREPRIPGDADNWDFGLSAGFYLDATQAPWSQNYRMESYVTRELPQIVAAHLPARPGAMGIFGHSMGGHGALTLGLRNPELYRSVSAFSPIAAPMQAPWGKKAFANYLGPDIEAWRGHDATELVARRPYPGPILIDQGDADQFLALQLMPEKFAAAAALSGQQLTLRMQPGYDHGYYFIQTFMADHLRHHAVELAKPR
ncbi:MAG TPA: S-formylglutathione hydrolase [Steroidobacteraceae bacterium]|jgi:S-formylglutathione hydrolase|nr:S-formylglutathione hydrolase [Steroidobacteraceae bacterium]